MRRNIFKRAWHLPLVELGLVVAIGAAATSASIEFAKPDPTPYRPAQIRPGKELVMVFIASSNCSGIRTPGIDEAIANLRSAYREKARQNGKNFVTIGVAVDWSIPKGTALLERFGPFDEVMIGRSWLNSGVVKYVWEDVPGIAGVPQVLLVERDVRPGERPLVGAERLMVRRAGAEALINWSQALAVPSATGTT